MHKITKRNHFVPEWYLKGFAAGGRVRILRRDGSGSTTSTQNAGAQSHLYSDNAPEAPRRDHIERFLDQSVDGPLSGPVRALIGDPSNLGDVDWDAVDDFVAWQLIRTPRFFALNETIGEHLFPNLLAFDAVGRLVRRYEEDGRRPPDQRELDEFTRRIKASLTISAIEFEDPRARLRLMIRMFEPTRAALEERKRVVAISAVDALLTSDHPAVLFRPTGPAEGFSGLLPGDCELWIPLSPGLLLMYTPFEAQSVVINLEQLTADLANRLQAQSCFDAIYMHPDHKLATLLGRYRPELAPEPTVTIQHHPNAEPTRLVFDQLQSDILNDVLADLGALEHDEEEPS